MHKISNLTGFGVARHGLDKMTPSIPFGSQRQQPDPSSSPGPMLKNARDASVIPRPPGGRLNQLSLSFNVPFSQGLAGPEPQGVIHASPGAFRKWTFPEDGEQGLPVSELPVHVQNVETLREFCKTASESSDGRVQASVTSSEPKLVPGLQLGGPSTAMVTNVCLSGDPDSVKKMRFRIFNEHPICLQCATVDIDQNLVAEPAPTTPTGIREKILEHIDYIASWTGTDIFLLRPKQFDVGTAGFNGTMDNSLDHRFRVAVYGDMESSEHAKTRILIMIDQILKRKVEIFKLELSMHTIICGRMRRNIKQIESTTNTAIYFPPPFPHLRGYCPPSANRRRDDEIFITANHQEDMHRAKAKLHELVRHVKPLMKEVKVSSDKVDNLILDRLEKIQRIMEYNGTYVLIPQLGVQRHSIRVQGTDMLHVERTIREVMAISGQFYSALWYVTLSEASQRAPTPADIKNMLADICISSGAEISFDKLTFHVFGSDDAVKAALWIISTLLFVRKAQSHLRVKIELANEHKEFVSGKKNGKINKIMSQSNVQVFFDLFNEYNFFIDVSGSTYEATKNGLDLVEQEMPASVAFHVPDSYHKRIIGIGGQHIQRIMKKYSVFVKFSNAMDRGGMSKEDDDIKVDNVICRTPARNAQNLDLVKQEIMDMVEKADAEFVSEKVIINRLYHRELLTRMQDLERLEQTWNCKVIFPSTEQASDVVTVTGPQYQVPKAKDDLLGMVPESHDIQFKTTPELAEYLASSDFQHDVVDRLKAQYAVELHIQGLASVDANEESQVHNTETLTLAYTRNNAGSLKDCIDSLTTQLVAHGLDASTVKGAIPRPKSDSFEDNLPFFDSKLFHRADPVHSTDSPTRSVFGEDGTNEQRSFLDRLRQPGRISSFLAGRRNSARSAETIARYASSNVSKASLISIESQKSGLHNPWNASHDSGLGLEDDNGGWPAQFIQTNGSSANLHSPFSLHFTGSTTSLSGRSTALPPPRSSHGLTPVDSFSQSATSLAPGDVTPKFDNRMSHDSIRPGTGHSSKTSIHGPGPIGPPPRSTS
ncbi:MAG: hypothetical protein Q9162_002523 [Coniocarpon cinnabarinum]